MKKYLSKEGKVLRKDMLYNYGTSLEREETAAFLLDYASRSKSEMCDYWKKMRRYYDGDHDIRLYQNEFSSRASIPWKAAQSTDGYIHVETQLQPSIPAFEFAPRDKTDFDKAKQREKIVKFIVDNNNMEYKNNRAERSLNIYGSAAYKVCWDRDARFSCDIGDVTVENADISRIYTDPSAVDVDGCEYIAYVYPMHKNKAKRVFAEDIFAKNCDFSDYLESSMSFCDPYKISSDAFDTSDDTVTVTEWWFRQPESGSTSITFSEDGIKRSCYYKWKAGDIALSIFINGKEVRYIPKYWSNTDFKSFPFVIYSRLPGDNSIWGKSELEQIIPLIDAKDRELTFAQLNSAFSSNDIIVAEENALCDGETLDNSPGTVWKLRPGMMGKVSRLGNGASAQSGLYANSAYWENLIESTTGNFDTNQGKEPSNITTATGIALLNERSQSRKNLKNADRTSGFKRLFTLIDMTALENYNDGRIIRMGFGEDDNFVFNYGGYIRRTREKRYIPSLDIILHLGSGIQNSKAFTVSSLTALLGMNINSDNYMIVKAYLRNIAIPESEEICSFLDSKFGNGGKALNKEHNEDNTTDIINE